MKRSAIRCLLAASVGAVSLLGATGVRADVFTLQNDGFTDGGEATFHGGFVAGEQGAVTLGPVAETFQVRKVQFLFGPTDDSQAVTLRIFNETGTATPGSEIFSADYGTTPSSEALQEVDLTSDNVFVPDGGSIRVSVEFQHDGFPGIANDDDGISPSRNWIDAQGFGWVGAGTLGVSGDFVIRAEVETAGTGGSGTGGSGTGGSGTGGSGTGGSGTGAGATVCIPGETQPCVGPGACQGGQSCLADGSGYGACECAPAESTPVAAEEDGGCALGGAVRRASTPAALAGAGGLVGLLAAVRRRRRGRR